MQNHPSEDWELAALPRRAGDVVLHLGCGSDRAALALAGEVRQVVAVDLDLDALTDSRSQAHAAGLDNVLFLHGDGAALPFLDASFRVAVCAHVLHHLDEPGAVLSELRRVIEPGGWLGLSEIVVDEDPDLADSANRLSASAGHGFVRAMSASELQDTLVRAGFEVSAAESRESRQPLAPWLDGLDADRVASITAELEAELAGGPRTGLTPRRDRDGEGSDRISVGCTHTALLILNRDG